jgi:hypothetical protein
MRGWVIGALALAGCGPEISISDFSVAPRVTWMFVDNDPVAEGAEYVRSNDTPIRFVAQVTDNDKPEQLLVTLTSDISGSLADSEQLTPSSTGKVEFATTLAEEGAHTVMFTASDSDGETGSAFVLITINEAAQQPVANVTAPLTNIAYYEGQPIKFEVFASDLQDAPQLLTGTVGVQGIGPVCDLAINPPGFQGDPEDSAFLSCEGTLPAGTHLIEYRIKDTEGYFAEVADLPITVLALTAFDDDGDRFSEDQGDCDDNRPDVSPGQQESEFPDGVDNNCDGRTDEGTIAFDNDGDTFSVATGDCNDADAAVYPGAIETCTTLYDDNCDGDPNNVGATGCSTFYVDGDGDGYGSPVTECVCAPGSRHSNRGDDCYDQNSAVWPGQLGWYSIHRGDGSYDYDCNSVDERQNNETGFCDWPCEIFNGFDDGWTSGVPSCGQYGDWLSDCSLDWFSCDETKDRRLQTCR